MIKCVLFDLDGVLADATEWHYRAFNNALLESQIEAIPHDTHLKYFNGLPTRTKIQLLRDQGTEISSETEDRIYNSKQEQTFKCIEEFCKPQEDKIELIKKLKSLGLKVGVCTNSIRKTLDLILELSGLSGYFDITLSNQDVSQPKPSPEIYNTAMARLGITPKETLIVEDSPKGAKAALDSEAYLLKVEGVHEVHSQRVLRKLAEVSYQNLQILIPMAGRGSRFARVGYTVPKPFIPVLGKPMIHQVVENLRVDSAKWFFVCLEDHAEMAKELLENKVNCRIVEQSGYKQGAACSAELAFKHLDLNAPIMLANSDQFIDMNIYDFLVEGVGCDGAIMTFKSEHPKWSYAKTNNDGYVTEVKEKCVISKNATSGVYLWNKAGDFAEGVYDMIEAGDTHNNEYYIAPSFNYCIQKGKKYRLSEIKRQMMWGLGTPEDLIKFVDHYEE